MWNEIVLVMYISYWNNIVIPSHYNENNKKIYSFPKNYSEKSHIVHPCPPKRQQYQEIGKRIERTSGPCDNLLLSPTVNVSKQRRGKGINIETFYSYRALCLLLLRLLCPTPPLPLVSSILCPSKLDRHSSTPLSFSQSATHSLSHWVTFPTSWVSPRPIDR